MRRCDECGREVERPYTFARFAVCGLCLEKLTRGMVSVERAVRRREAA
jgi:hypothetical protein